MVTNSMSGKAMAIKPELILSVNDFKQPSSDSGRRAHATTRCTIGYSVDSFHTTYDSSATYVLNHTVYFVEETFNEVLNLLKETK